MELKFDQQKWLQNLRVVLIAPLWNWNDQLMILIFPRFESSNRTFMELKFQMSPFWIVFPIVLIAPLWNWNEVAESILISEEASSNRTFMELKFEGPFNLHILWEF